MRSRARQSSPAVGDTPDGGSAMLGGRTAASMPRCARRAALSRCRGSSCRRRRRRSPTCSTQSAMPDAARIAAAARDAAAGDAARATTADAAAGARDWIDGFERSCAEASAARAARASPRSSAARCMRASWRRWTSTSSTTRSATCSRSATTSTDRRRDASYYDLLASEARLGELRRDRAGAGAAGELVRARPPAHGDRRRAGAAVVERLDVRVPDAAAGDADLRGHAARPDLPRRRCERQIEYGRERGVPWGISESGYNTVDAGLNYQYRAFGVPGLGLKRGLAEDLVIAPYATALALMVAPREARAATCSAGRARRCSGSFGFYEAIDYTPARLRRGETIARRALVHGAPPGHEPARARRRAARPADARRFAAEPLFQATLLLLQERVPRASATFIAQHRTGRPARRRRHDGDAGARVHDRRTRRCPRCSCCRTAATT